MWKNSVPIVPIMGMSLLSYQVQDKQQHHGSTCQEYQSICSCVGSTNWCSMSQAIPVISQLAIYYPKLSTTFYTMHSVSAVIFWCTYQFMKMMARVKHSLQGEVLDCGTDLNMKNGLAEHCKDIIILTSIAIILSVASEWCWLLLLLAPLRALYLFWIHIASPWFFAPAPEVEEISEKKQRRMERKQTKFKRA
ncbi:transmembrane protein 208-like isoform X1 [Watersipora subatra]|uniref:transmembrane protein 208-like isoform X1 n=1 Tax=Watersipora subatra TaxID=2589382 RepID=UPI00355B81BC